MDTRADGWQAAASDLVVAVPLFLSSYAPLLLILAIRFSRPWLQIVCGALALGGFAVALLVIRRYRSLVPQEWVVQRVDERGGEVAGYLASYLLPFVSVPEPGWRDLAAYVVFLLVAAVIYIRSSMIQVNPTLYLLGWRLSAVSIGDAWNGYLLSRHAIAAGAPMTVVRMTERFFIEGPTRSTRHAA